MLSPVVQHHLLGDRRDPHQPGLPPLAYQCCVVAPELLTMPPAVSGGSNTD